METIQKTLNNLPHEPGVYLYRDKHGTIIYVGKAVDLSRRVKQYFQRTDSLSDKTKRLVSDIASIETIRVTSEFDALLLEAKLIRSYLPKYNIISRDDKSPLYVGLTLSETLPRVVFLRKGQLAGITKNKRNAVYGPFQSAHALRILLRQVRGAVPYCLQKSRTGKPCFYTHLGLCNPCPSEIAGMPDDERRKKTAQYRKNIYRLKALFDGKSTRVMKDYEHTMKQAAARLDFEEAGHFKKRIDSLYAMSQYRYDPAVFLEEGVSRVYEHELSELIDALSPYYPALSSLSRIECFDMSQLYGTNAVGSMVVLTDGRADTSQYRKFRIRSSGTVSDTSMMREVLIRRMKHKDWPQPQFVLVDGGKPQVQVARIVWEELGLHIPFAGLAKHREEIILPDGAGYKTLRLPMSGRAIKVLQRIRDEAHRFAVTYHRTLREKRAPQV